MKPIEPELHIDNPGGSPTLVLAHGAGAGMDTSFMNFFAAALSGRGLRVVRFEFPYMARRRETGKGGARFARDLAAVVAPCR